MASNQNVNKVVYGGNTLVDLTGDTAVASDVISGKTFHLASGAQATGTAVVPQKQFFSGICNTYESNKFKVTLTDATGFPGSVNGTVVSVYFPAMPSSYGGNVQVAMEVNETGGAYVYSRGTQLFGAEDLNTRGWGSKDVVIFQYADSHWNIIGKNTNTTYSTMTQSQIDAGTSTTGMLISPKLLVDNFGSGAPFSFVGMVVQGTNLATLSDVQAIYGSNTTWQLISSVALASEHVFGNGIGLGIAINNDRTGSFKSGTVVSSSSGYGSETGASNSSTNVLTSNRVIGLVTKTQAGTSPQNSGLIADTVTVYSWERTA